MFQFKQFRINQDRCAMKVGTDSILLGAWTKVPDAKRILDLGAGTGILALMMAQKLADAKIDAVELDKASAIQCKENVSNAPWKDRIQVFQEAVQDFAPAYLYDLIISNPPYFSQDLAAFNPERSLARQGANLSIEDLIFQMDRLLSPVGIGAIVFPYSSLSKLEKALLQYGLFIYRICLVHPRAEKNPKRILITMGREQKRRKSESLIIQAGGANEYSEEYVKLTADFYRDLS